MTGVRKAISRDEADPDAMIRGPERLARDAYVTAVCHQSSPLGGRDLPIPIKTLITEDVFVATCKFVYLEAGVGFAYAPNKMGFHVWDDPRRRRFAMPFTDVSLRRKTGPRSPN